MMNFRKVLRAIFAGVVVMVAGATPSRAVDYQPFDWVPAPRGASVLMGYYQFATHNELTNTITKIHHRRFRRLDVLRREHRCGTGPSNPSPGLVLERLCVADIRRHVGGPARDANRGSVIPLGRVCGDVRWRCEAGRRPERIQDGRASDQVQLFAVRRAHLAGIAVAEPRRVCDGSVQAGLWTPPADCKGPLRGHP